MKTLFLKDSVLFISMDGKEYEVSNPMDTGFSVVIGDTIESFLDRFIKPGEKIEWPGEVELNWRIAISTASDTKYTPCTEEYAKSKPGFHSYAVARLLPNEKKIYNPALSGYKPESDYRGGKSVFDAWRTFDEDFPPAPVESQEEMWREVKKIIQTSGVSYLYKLEKKFSITRLTP